MNQKTTHIKEWLQQLYGDLKRWQGTLTPLGKVGWVFAGYVLAVVAAAGALACKYAVYYVLGIHNIDSGMQAFGDLLSFIAVFGISSIPATVLMLGFLSDYPAFWHASSFAALVLGVIGIAASVIAVVNSASIVGGLALMLVLAAPLCALAFGISGIFSPIRGSRLSLFAAASLEAMAFALWFVSCVIRNYQS
jgi:hypothetical protein